MAEKKLQTSKSWRRMGDHFATDPSQWAWQAGFFITGAQVCWDHYLAARESFSQGQRDSQTTREIGLARIAYYLMAVATELLLKAVVLRNDPEASNRGEFYKHDLVLLASKGEITLERSEASLLAKLHKVLDWAGRYPIPRWDTEKGRQKFDVQAEVKDDESEIIDANQLSSNSYTPEAWEVACQFVTRLLSLVRERDKQR
jgi:hypothetical protein